MGIFCEICKKKKTVFIVVGESEEIIHMCSNCFQEILSNQKD
jgi:hypothetical protein